MRPVPLPRRNLFLLLIGAVLATGCGGPTSPQTLGPILVCPANLTVQSLDGNASPVIYEPPALIAGEPPIKTTCNPASGSLFQFGPSTVTCNATDAALRTASCAFTVTVTAPAKIASTSFMAFGNSITEGKNGSGTPLAKNYPEDLRVLLSTRYTSQAITVANKGVGGETAANGVSRLPLELSAVRPQVLLLEEGVNDISGGDPASINPMVDALRSMVREAKSRNVTVFLATLTPVRAGGTPPKGDSVLPLIPQVNTQIRVLAQAEQVTLVDLFQGFGGVPDPYIDIDGLHPNEAGYQKIAQIFFDAIRLKLEIAPNMAPSGLVRNLPSATPFATIQ